MRLARLVARMVMVPIWLMVFGAGVTIAAQQPATFDLAAARADGYPDSAIAEHLAPIFGYDLKGARAAGLPDSEIADLLGRMPFPPNAPLPSDALTQTAAPADAQAQAPDANAIGAGVRAALKAGYTPEQIVSVLAHEPSFNVSAALKAGYSDGEIVAYLARLPAEAQPTATAGSGLLHGFGKVGPGASTQGVPPVSASFPSPTIARDALSARDIYSTARSSVVLLISYDANNQPLALGSGFFVKHDTIATNMHVIEGAASVKAKLMSGETESITTIRGIDPEHDLVLVESSIQQTELPLQASRPDIGAPIVAMGNPKGLEGTISTGIISGIRQDKTSTYYQITAPISPGSSGGPVINQNGEVVGISTFTLTEGQNLNFAIPATYIDHLLTAPKEMPLSAVRQSASHRAILRGYENVRVTDPSIEDGSLKGSVLNGTDGYIRRIRILAVFDSPSNKAEPVEYMNFQVYDVVPPHLAKRFSEFNSELRDHGSGVIETLVKIKDPWLVSFRVMDYEIVKGDMSDFGVSR